MGKALMFLRNKPSKLHDGQSKSAIHTFHLDLHIILSIPFFHLVSPKISYFEV